jgi:hypothetical protein
MHCEYYELYEILWNKKNMFPFSGVLSIFSIVIEYTIMKFAFSVTV